MGWRPKDLGKPMDLAAAGTFAAAIGFAASALASGYAALLAAPAFALAYGGLRRVDSDTHHALADFALAPVDAPCEPAARPNDGKVVHLFAPPSAQGRDQAVPDAAEALSVALAGLKRSLR